MTSETTTPTSADDIRERVRAAVASIRPIVSRAAIRALRALGVQP